MNNSLLAQLGHTCTSSISSPSLHHPPFLTPPPISSLPPPSSSTTAAAPKHKPPAHSSASRRHLDFTAEVAAGSGGAVPDGCLAEVLRRLPPPALLAAAQVCREWRECAALIWAATEEIRISVGRRPTASIGTVLKKCPMLARLSLRIESEIDATVLAYIAFICPNLEGLEIRLAESAANRITGDELGRFVSESKYLSVLKIEGCTNLGRLALYSSSLVTLWLSDLYCLSETVLNCPSLKELSLDFVRDENDSTDLCSMAENLGRSCPRLRNVHIASVRLSHNFVLALTSANLRSLRMLALLLGSEITDASVAAIASSYSSLELLDLSGSSITDNGIGMICNVFQRSLSRLLLAFCPNITSSGIQFAAAQLPLLQLIDCGMPILDPCSRDDASDAKGMLTDKNELGHGYYPKPPVVKLQSICQKLIIKHSRLKKLSLWGCSGLDALYLNCPELQDLNINSCTNLQPEGVILQCPNLKTVHASGCKKKLIGAIQDQVFNDFTSLTNSFQSKRLADGSKRVQVPQFGIQHLQSYDEDTKKISSRPRWRLKID
ncbi:F-box/LRR-repeat protein 17 [Nymphaea thermarum]|nr:F-box/LRR-repeat protein 17 [Nymphaea thermarum]